MNPVTIRAVVDSDCDMLLAWRNVPEVIPLMHSQRAIPLEEHLAWWHDPTRPVIWIAQEGLEPVGMIRFDAGTHPTWRSLSILVPTKYQGNGVGTRLLQEALAYGESMGFAGYESLIHQKNLPSRQLFASHGFRMQPTDELEWLRYHRTLSSQPERSFNG